MNDKKRQKELFLKKLVRDKIQMGHCMNQIQNRKVWDNPHKCYGIRKNNETDGC
jgi:hypothetical protein